MPLVRMDALLQEARERGYAVAAFECWNSANVYAIARGAAACEMPVIFQASAAEYNAMGGAKALREIVSLYVNMTGITAALHLDHGTTLEHVRECVDAGFTGVMLDASRLPYEDNVALTRQAVSLAHAHNVPVEAELGHVAGCEADLDDSGYDADLLTDPVQAAEYVARTGLDCLAVAIGTVHGAYKAAPRIDLDRLDAIASSVSVPLVLHGGSGTPRDVVQQAIHRGITKINVCTDIHVAWLDGIAEARASLTPSVPGRFYAPAQERLERVVRDTITLFAMGRARPC